MFYGAASLMAGFVEGFINTKTQPAKAWEGEVFTTYPFCSSPTINFNKTINCEYCRSENVIFKSNCKNCGAPLLRKI